MHPRITHRALSRTMAAAQHVIRRPIAPFPKPPQGLVRMTPDRSIPAPPTCLCSVQLFAPIEEGEQCHVCDRSATYMILEHMVFWCPTHADILRAKHPLTQHIQFLGRFPKTNKYASEHAHCHAVKPGWEPWEIEGGRSDDGKTIVVMSAWLGDDIHSANTIM